MVRRLIDNLTEGLDALRASLPDLPDLSLVRTVEIPIYLVHRSGDAEDYIFLIDFHRFMAESQTGSFVRPRLRVWAGRQDFQRHIFARRLRETFSDEFRRMQAELAESVEREKSDKGSSGWFALDLGLGAAALGAGWLNTLILYLAVSTGKAAWDEVRKLLGVMVRGDRPDARIAELDKRIEEKKKVIDAALGEIEITLHRELWEHAYRGLPPGPMTGMDRQAWPLPDEVRCHLEQRVSGSWW